MSATGQCKSSMIYSQRPSVSISVIKNLLVRVNAISRKSEQCWKSELFWPFNAHEICPEKIAGNNLIHFYSYAKNTEKTL